MRNKKITYERCNFFVRFAYHGAAFCGVQEQRGQQTVLGALRARIEAAALQQARSLVASARTDRGVSALANYASFYVREPFNAEAFVKAMHVHKHDGLYSVIVQMTHGKFHARGNALSKTYRYTIKDCVSSPRETTKFYWELCPRLSVAAMQFAAQDFVGVKDFSSVRGGGCEAGSPIKHIFSVAITRTKLGYIVIDITGEGFLRRMVRNMIGLLVEIGAGLRPCDAIPAILLERARSAAGIMAPPQGLLLLDVALKEI